MTSDLSISRVRKTDDGRYAVQVKPTTVPKGNMGGGGVIRTFNTPEAANEFRNIVKNSGLPQPETDTVVLSTKKSDPKWIEVGNKLGDFQFEMAKTMLLPWYGLTKMAEYANSDKPQKEKSDDFIYGAEGKRLSNYV